MSTLPLPQDPSPTGFAALELDARLLQALTAKGYSEPTAIQDRAIPALLAGRDLLGQAQTGTGKTAAFALPLLHRLRLEESRPQALVLAPTRELAVQVHEAILGYAGELPGLASVAVYGGAPIFGQLKALGRHPQVVVGTPGRIMDCIRRGALDLGGIAHVVLDEADEMLRMGFLEDVEWILSHTPAGRQTALFSATMPGEIRAIAQRHLRSPEHVIVGAENETAGKIEQRCLVVPHRQKLPALCRVLEAEASDAVLIFARTRSNCNDLTERLQERGFTCSALHGDVSQSQREEIVRALKSGRTKIVVATDVAARGLDVDGITHVINFDMPMDAETYVHRIGRTGRAGRTGISILLLTPRERRALRTIESFTGQPMREVAVPRNGEIAERRVAEMRRRVAAGIEGQDLAPYRQLVQELLAAEAAEWGPVELAAVLARLAAGDKPLVFDEPELDAPEHRDPRDGDRTMLRLFVSAGRDSGLRPGQLVAAVANAAGIPGKAIGAIDIRKSVSFFDLDERFADALRDNAHRVAIRGQRVQIRRARPERGQGSPRPARAKGPRGPRPFPPRRKPSFRKVRAPR